MSRKAVTRIALGTMEMGKRMNFEESEAFLKKFQEYGHTELDTAYMYAGGADGGANGGVTEEFMGKIDTVDGLNVATKANPAGGKTLSPKSVRHQLETSMKKLNTECVDLFYLHWPCMDVNIEDTLCEVNNLHKEGKFQRFGLSNFISWQVAEVQQICIHNGYIQPTVYQGMYNCLTRLVEKELFLCLRKYGMSFYCYNPLAGGLLTGKHIRDDNPENVSEPGRFAGKEWGKAYRDRFWRDKYFDALDIIQDACEKEGVARACPSLRQGIPGSDRERFPALLAPLSDLMLRDKVAHDDHTVSLERHQLLSCQHRARWVLLPLPRAACATRTERLPGHPWSNEQRAPARVGEKLHQGCLFEATPQYDCDVL